MSVGCCHDGKGNLEKNTDFGRDFDALFRFHWERIDSDYSKWSNNWLSDFNDWAGFLSFGELPQTVDVDPNEYLWEYHEIAKQLNVTDHDFEYSNGPYPFGNVKPMVQIYVNEDPVRTRTEMCDTGDMATCYEGPPPGKIIFEWVGEGTLV